jgi:hypothetical protein
MSATDIVAYTYRAENLCPHCIMAKFNSDGRLGTDVETVLDWHAGVSGIDRGDERTFDSGDFPKVVFGSQIESDERCNGCGESLS